jgi:hypothetical protein
MRDRKPRLENQNWLTPNSRTPEHGQRWFGTPKMGGTHAHLIRIQNAVEFPALMFCPKSLVSYIQLLLHSAVVLRLRSYYEREFIVHLRNS